MKVAQHGRGSKHGLDPSPIKSSVQDENKILFSHFTQSTRYLGEVHKILFPCYTSAGKQRTWMKEAIKWTLILTVENIKNRIPL